MAYERLHWVESETPLSADNMNNIEDGIEELQSQKVDKVSGKDLSDQNYTAAEKTKLAGIEAGAQVNPGAATTSTAGLMSAADKAKLDGIEAGAEVNLGIVIQGESVNEDALEIQFNAPFMVAHGGEGTPGAITRTETISIPAASSSNNGYMSKEDKAKLNGIEEGATALKCKIYTFTLDANVTVNAGSTATLVFEDFPAWAAIQSIKIRGTGNVALPTIAIIGFYYSANNFYVDVRNLSTTESVLISSAYTRLGVIRLGYSI